MDTLDIAYKEFEIDLMKESNLMKTLLDRATIMMESSDDSILYEEAGKVGLFTRIKERFLKIIRKIKEFLFGKKIDDAQKQIDSAIEENPQAGNVVVEVNDTKEVSSRFKKLTKAFQSGKNFASEHKMFMALLAGGAGVAIGAGIAKKADKKSSKTVRIKTKDTKKYVMSRREELKFIEKAYADMDFDRIIHNHSISEEQRRAAIVNKRLAKDTRFDPNNLSVINQYFDAVNAYGDFLNTSTYKAMKITISEVKNIERKKKNGEYGDYAISKDIKNSRDNAIRSNTRKVEARSQNIPFNIMQDDIEKNKNITKNLKSEIETIKKTNDIRDLRKAAENKASEAYHKTARDTNEKLEKYYASDKKYKNKYKK